MMRFAVAAAGLTIFLAVPTAGCSNHQPTSASSTTSAATVSSTGQATPSSASADFTSLLIKGSDLTAPGQTFTASAPTLHPNGRDGVAVRFSNDGDTEEVGDTILILPDEASAVAALHAAQSALGESVPGGVPQPSPVGSNGWVVSGTSPDGSKSVTLLLFTQGRAFTTIEFDGAPDDPVPPEGVLDVGQK
ncbi:MAG: hypothetical protein QOD90_1478, partial [Mycobacterium sp.]|nr:hypothetical protein [Mycobacterium sp.]